MSMCAMSLPEPLTIEPIEPVGTVLVVDDDTLLRSLVRASLEQSGFVVAEADNAEAGLELFGEQRHDIVLLDVLMPGIDGFEACARLRAMAGGNHVPIAMLTGLDDTDAINHAYDVGATDFITKPINWPSLGHRLRYLLRASRAFADLARSESRLALAQRIARLGHCEWVPTATTMNWDSGVYTLLGLDPAAGPPTWETLLSIAVPIDRIRGQKYIDDARSGSVPIGGFDLRLVPNGAGQRIVHVRMVPGAEREDGSPNLQVIFQDVTDHRLAEEQIRYLEFYDNLTGLPNRRWMREQLAAMLESAQRDGAMVAVMLLDLDQFKRINDTLGHSAGDRLLQRLATRIQRCLREVDPGNDAGEARDRVASVSWFGGDEFTVLLPHLPDPQDVARIVPRLLSDLEQPMELGGMEISVTGSIGVAIFPHDGTDPDTLLKNADVAMYRAKEDGRNRFKFYDHGMNATAMKKLSLENELRKAIERDEFVLYYQPQVDVVTGRVVGAEALIRWQRPDGELRQPGEFMPVAEQSEVCIPIGEWVTRTACQQNKAWQDAGLPHIPIAVNLSGRHFRHPRFVDSVLQTLRQVGLPPSSLELEITETILLHDLEIALPTLDQLRAIGVRLSIDDFGTGYSSLSRLKRLPLDTLKIDRSFVRDIATDRDDAAITTAIVAMALSLELGVIAEGVETIEQADYLRRHGCREMQGYLFGRPMPAERFYELLRERADLTGVLAPI